MAKQRAVLVFKYTVYTLLIVNVAVFLRDPRGQDFVGHKAIDQIGWLILLGVFEWETRSMTAGRAAGAFIGWPLAVELTGYAFACYALAHYLADRDWLEVGNAVTWLAISAMIWLDILRPVAVGSTGQRWRAAAKALLYIATLGFALAWGWIGAALDFYDAALWILCFFVIELNILRFEKLARRIAA